MTCRSDACCQGRIPCPTPAFCADHQFREPQGYESGGSWPEPAEDCELIGPPYALFAAILGIVTVVIGIGGLLWIGFTLAPLFATVHF